MSTIGTAGLQESVNSLFLMVDIEWGLECYDPQNPPTEGCEETALNFMGYIRANADVTLQLSTNQSDTRSYKAVPEMDFEMIESLKGGTADEQFRLLMPLHIYPINVMVGNPFPTARITVYQCRLGEPGVPSAWGGTNFSRRLLARGRLGRTVARYNGRPDIVSVECYRNKAALQSVTLGLTTSQRCYWRFGDSSCQFNLNTAIASGTCTAISNTDIDIALTISTIGAALVDQRMHGFQAFQYGFVEHDGLRIFVREHRECDSSTPPICTVSDGPLIGGVVNIRLVLAFQPPIHPNYTWLGKTIKVVGGCAKNKSSCVEKWNNAEHFGGFGLLVPNHNPVWEVGGGTPA